MDKTPFAKKAAMSRRRFLQTSAGAIALIVSGIPVLASTHRHHWSPTPGVAKERIDGFTKVTGGKIYARDFNSRNLADYGMPKHQWYAMFLRATTTSRVFVNADLSSLPDQARPRKVILGNDLSSGQLNPKVQLDRDLLVEEERIDQSCESPHDAPTSLNHPHSVEYDLLVQPGNSADFLGQATALLLFDSLKAYKAARRAIQFNDKNFQVYEDKYVARNLKVFLPETRYVRNAYDKTNSDGFSFYSSNKTDYPKQSLVQADKIKQQLAEFQKDNPDLVSHDFSADMRAMDPMFMEPESGIVWYSKYKKRLVVLLGTQSPDGDVADIAEMYRDNVSQLQVDEVELISCFPGGGFGGRDKSPFSLMLALCADFADGNPVKLEYDRFEQFRVGLKRHACNIQGTLVALPDQTMLSLHMNLIFDGGGRKNLSPYVAALGALCAGGNYRLPMANVFANAHHSENISGGSQRGFGGPQAFFALETAIDEVATKMNWDPLEFRKKNLVSTNDTTIVGGPISQELRLAEMLEITAKHPLWANRDEIKRQHSDNGIHYGTGLAMSFQAYGTSGDGVVAAIKINEDGSYQLHSDAIDMGNGSATTLGVVIGEILGANASTVEMGGYNLFKETGLKTDRHIGCKCGKSWNEKQLPDYTKKSVGSSSACLTGLHQVHVTQQCAHVVFANTILRAAAQLWQLSDSTFDTGDYSGLSWQDGSLHYTNAGEIFPPLDLPTIAETVYREKFDIGAVVHAYFQNSWVSAKFPTATGEKTFELDGIAYYPAPDDSDTDRHAKPVKRGQTDAMDCNSSRAARYVWAPCVNVIGVTVDKSTGAVRIENVLSVLNAGRVHVEPLVSGQSQGGVAMAIGYTLLEDMAPGMIGPANGKTNLNNYHVAHMQDVPINTRYKQGERAQELIILDETPGDKKQGRGIAEAVMCSIAPAISNALRDAVNVRYTSLPITPAKIRQGIRQ